MISARLAAVLLLGAVGVPAPRKNAPKPHQQPPAVAVKAPAGSVDKDFNACRKVPAGQRLVKLTLKPDTTVDDLVVWISSVTCRQFVWAEAVASRNKKVTIVAPLPMTPRQAFGLFLNALDAIGLTVEPSGTFWRIVETHKVKSTPVPLYGFDGRRLPG
jgi:general secretion pathway protein D